MTEDHDLLIRVDENVRNLNLSVSTNFKDHEMRIRLMEDEQNQVRGVLKTLRALAALSTLAALIASALGTIALTHHH